MFRKKIGLKSSSVCEKWDDKKSIFDDILLWWTVIIAREWIISFSRDFKLKSVWLLPVSKCSSEEFFIHDAMFLFVVLMSLKLFRLMMKDVFFTVPFLLLYFLFLFLSCWCYDHERMKTRKKINRLFRHLFNQKESSRQKSMWN